MSDICEQVKGFTHSLEVLACEHLVSRQEVDATEKLGMESLKPMI